MMSLADLQAGVREWEEKCKQQQSAANQFRAQTGNAVTTVSELKRLISQFMLHVLT